MISADTPSVSFADSSPIGGAHYHFRRQRLAAARSRHGSDSPPDCHSLPCRHFATLKGRPRNFIDPCTMHLSRTLSKSNPVFSQPIIELDEVCYRLRCCHQLAVPRLTFVFGQKLCQFIFLYKIKQRRSALIDYRL